MEGQDKWKTARFCIADFAIDIRSLIRQVGDE